MNDTFKQLAKVTILIHILLLLNCAKKQNTNKTIIFEKSIALNIINEFKKNKDFDKLNNDERNTIITKVFPRDTIITFNESCPLLFNGIADVVAIFLHSDVGLNKNDPYNNLLSMIAISRYDASTCTKENDGLYWDNHNSVYLTSYNIYEYIKEAKCGEKYTGKIIIHTKNDPGMITILELRKISE